MAGFFKPSDLVSGSVSILPGKPQKIFDTTVAIMVRAANEVVNSSSMITTLPMDSVTNNAPTRPIVPFDPGKSGNSIA